MSLDSRNDERSTSPNLIRENLKFFRFQKENRIKKIGVDGDRGNRDNSGDRRDREACPSKSEQDSSTCQAKSTKLTKSNVSPSSSSSIDTPVKPKVYNKIISISSSSEDEEVSIIETKAKKATKDSHAKSESIKDSHTKSESIKDSHENSESSNSSNSPVKKDSNNEDLTTSNNHTVKNAMANLCDEKFSERSNRKRNRKDADASQSNNGIVQKEKRRRKDLMEDIKDDNDNELDDDDDEQLRRERVFDSDAESDEEVSGDMNENKKQVLHFLNTATNDELLMMRCTPKRAEAIISLRPYSGWIHLVNSFRENRSIGSDVLNNAQDFLYSRYAVENLMKKCLKIAKQLKCAIKEGSNHIKEQPPNLNTTRTLTPYQLIGLNWLYIMHKQKLNAILADEMGLGKTIQVISFLAYLKHLGYRGAGPHLIVVPSSTLDNWNNELKLWCPSLKVILYYGSPMERKMLRCSLVRDGMDDIDVILTTYNIISGSVPEDRKMFRVFKMDYVIFDEAHWLKNMNTQRYDVLIRLNAQSRILLTGTPTQNNLVELMSLLVFLMPKIFAAKKDILQKLFSKMPKNLTDACSNPSNGIPFEREQVKRAKQIMTPFILRRLKRDVLKELPNKSDETCLVEMSDSQKELYNGLISAFNKEPNKLDEESSIEEESSSRMSMLMQLRKAANHPCLLREYYTDDMISQMASYLVDDILYKEKNKNYIIEDLAIQSDFQLFQLSKEYKTITSFVLPKERILNSGKFLHLNDLLLKLHSGGHRVLIFSQFVIVLNILEEFLKIKKYKFLRLDGSTAVQIRQDLIDEFNQDDSIFIFILSTRAGGLGINLTAADTVIIHDIDFNPYNDKQAEDRCHRMGQTKPVSVIRLLSKGTVEEDMFQIAQEKLNLEKQLTGEGEDETLDTKNVLSLLKKALYVGGSPTKQNAH